LFDKKKWKKRIKTILTLDSHPGHIALGFAVGVFISFTPFIGIHTLIAIVIAFVFRLNKVTCVTATWVNTPFTVIPVLGLSYKLGNLMLGEPAVDLNVKSLEWQYLKGHAASLLLGCSIIGFIAAVISYFVCYYLIVRFRQKDETLKEITKEMEEVGEEIRID
jgi:uncharacterized protein